ncbi:MAG TPA: SGNH/GDSL hydrolase family protein [Planctomycetota bacterium]|nr:SGNH/GDSL hydrolase family protein [Planctomycetota bacterium]HRR79414.1 SGNH/GDSL hydrolase family protein [Planctomycetota bacterium]HRT93493.1 SGNH/GDSL hydrolase family protein [Planctomycetota bacterium]
MTAQFASIASVLALAAQWASAAATPSFSDFDARARAGERLHVVFFGASLTWGANATEPNLTSYRGRMADLLEERYPQARWKFHDAAIGGTGSQLGVFRLDRDVLRHRPDLVFLDFSANDDIYSDSPETLASYEAIVRRIITEAKCPLVIVLFPFQWNVAAGTTDGMKRRDVHLALAKAYNVPVGDAIALGQRLVREGKLTIPQIWPVDGVHPGDVGYRMFADAAWQGFLQGVEGKLACEAPSKMLYADTYMASARVRISSLGKLPAGWRVGAPHLTSAWYDALMSRWLDDLAIASNRTTAPDPETKKDKAVPQQAAPLKVKFSGSMVMLFGEKTLKSGKFRCTLDGKVVEHKDWATKKTLTEFDASARQFGGNTHLTQVIAEGLDPAAEHTLAIEPIFDADAEQELRLESICVAGGKAKVWREE